MFRQDETMGKNDSLWLRHCCRNIVAFKSAISEMHLLQTRLRPLCNGEYDLFSCLCTSFHCQMGLIGCQVFALSNVYITCLIQKNESSNGA